MTASGEMGSTGARVSTSFVPDTMDISSEEEENDGGVSITGSQSSGYLVRTWCFLVIAMGVIGSGISLIFPRAGGDFHIGEFFGDHSDRKSPSEPLSFLQETASVEDLEYGAVASDHPVCSEIGMILLRDHGGNAVDAAVATALCLGVANPASSGIGGGAFILVHADMISATHKGVVPEFIDARDPKDVAMQQQSASGMITEVIDCRETAPGAATKDMFTSLPESTSTLGGLAIAVPGELRGLELAHSRHGALPWSTVVEPAMKLARDGVLVRAHLASDIRLHSKDRFQFDGLRTILTKDNDNKTMLREGDTMIQGRLAQTLRDIMEHGSDAMYKARAKGLANDIQQMGGIITENDIINYRPTLRSPLIAHDVGDYTLVGAPPPSSGGAAILGAARFLTGYNANTHFSDPLSKHRMVEAMRHAFAIRMSLSDPSFNTGVTLDAVNDLVSGSYMESLRQITLDNDTLPLSLYGGKKWAQLKDVQGGGNAQDANEGDRQKRLGLRHRSLRKFGYLEDHGTTHLSVVDKDKNAVSITSSVNTYFGSGIVSQSTGILLNNQMDDFSTPGRANFFGLEPSEANYIEPGKKPLSSMSPTLIFHQRQKDDTTQLGELFMALGASGGPKIISATLQSFLNHAHGKMSLFHSVTHPRLHDQLLYHETAVTLFEKAKLEQDLTLQVSEQTKKGLTSLGHRILAVGYSGCVQAIAVHRVTKRLSAVADIRKNGSPSGY